MVVHVIIHGVWAYSSGVQKFGYQSIAGSHFGLVRRVMVDRMLTLENPAWRASKIFLKPKGEL